MSIWAVGIQFELLFGQIHSKDVKQLLPYRMGMFQQPRAESHGLLAWRYSISPSK